MIDDNVDDVDDVDDVDSFVFDLQEVLLKGNGRKSKTSDSNLSVGI